MFTFKTEKPTGKWRAFSEPSHYIKLKGKIIGSISTDSPHRIRLMVVKTDINEDGNPNCIWKWVLLKHQSESLDAAKAWLKENYELIKSKYTLHLFQ